MSGQNLASGTTSISVDAIKYYFNQNPATAKPLATSPLLTNLALQAGNSSATDLNFIFQAPLTATPGNYLSQIIIGAVSS